MLACPAQASTINGRASSVSPLWALPGRLRAWLRSRAGAARVQGAATPHLPRRGARLQRRLEARKDVQWEFRDNEARYRDLLDNQADVILRRDAQGQLTFVNQAFCRTFGLDRSGVLGHVFKPCVLAGDATTPLAPSSDRRHQRYVQQIETARGPRWFEWEEHAVVADATAISEVQCSGCDITERRRTEAD